MVAERKKISEIAIVKWRDPQSHYDGWTSRKKAIKKKAATVVSVGLLISKDEDYIRIALDTIGGKEYHGVGVIPMGSVVSVQRFKIDLKVGILPKAPSRR